MTSIVHKYKSQGSEKDSSFGDQYKGSYGYSSYNQIKLGTERYP